MSAITKTGKLQRIDIPLSKLVKNEHNPNEMSSTEFNLLVSNIEKTGVTDPILVRPLGDGTYRIVGGHHRFEACSLLDFTEVPCTVINDPEFDEDAERFQIVRMNMIKGKLNPTKFLDLYNQMDKKYAADIMAEAFGFADENQFKKLIGEMAKSLPLNLQKEFKKAAEQIKTIDGLSKLLNQMFAKHGENLPYGYMMVDFGGKESVWLRMAAHDHKKFLEVAELCKTRSRGVDSLFRLFMQSIASEKLDWMLDALKDFPEVQDDHVEVAP